VFQSRTTPSAVFDSRTSTCRRSVAWVNTPVGVVLNEPSEHKEKEVFLNARQVWRPACNRQEAEFELAHCGVNLESGNKVMRTTAAIFDRALTSDCGSRHSLRREMGDALLRHRPVFYRSAFRYLGNATDAEDAVQDALLSAYKHIGQFKGQARISTWLSAIVINSALMQLRRRSRQPQVSLNEQNPEQESHALCDRLPDRGPTPEEACRGAELAEHVHRLVRPLSPTLRRTFQLRELDRPTIRETANVLGVAEGTVKALLARARTRLRLLVRKRLGGPISRPPIARSLAAMRTMKATPDRKPA
jgi:RNA polymerase sigma-70 factor (ECF subfamily)